MFFKPKFMVIKLKDLIKTAAFAVLGVMVVIALIWFFLPNNNESANAYNPGVYTSDITVGNETLSVEVTVNKSSIVAIDLVHTSETVPVFYPIFETAAKDMSKKIIKKQSLNVSVPEETAVTGEVFLAAVGDCIAQAQE